MMPHPDLTGMTFGKLTVESFAYQNNARLNFWNCRCECGNTIIARSVFLKKGIIQSCGCPAKQPPAEPEEVKIEVGQMVRFDPFQSITGFSSELNRGNYQTGKVVYVNQPHKWFQVEIDGQRTSFKFCDINESVHII